MRFREKVFPTTGNYALNSFPGYMADSSIPSHDFKISHDSFIQAHYVLVSSYCQVLLSIKELGYIVLLVCLSGIHQDALSLHSKLKGTPGASPQLCLVAHTDEEMGEKRISFNTEYINK